VADTIDVLKALGPQYSSEPDATLETFLELAAQELDAQAWGSVYQQAVVLLALHKLTMRDRGEQKASTVSGGSSGPVDSVSTGDLSISFGSSTGFATSGVEVAALAQTSYGKQFLELRAKTITGPYMTTGDI